MGGGQLLALLVEFCIARLGVTIGFRELAGELLDLLVSLGQRGDVVLRLFLALRFEAGELALELPTCGGLLGGLAPNFAPSLQDSP